MTCAPDELAAAAKCFCFDAVTERRVAIYLLCQWANRGGPPPPVEEGFLLEDGGGYILFDDGGRIKIQTV